MAAPICGATFRFGKEDAQRGAEAAAGAIGLALMVPPLELIPFASSAPMIAITVFGLALLAHDGVLMLLALLLVTGAVAVGASLFFHFR